MEITPLQRRFIRTLRDCLLHASVRQKEMAEALGISSSALSQMLQGKWTLSQKQLNTFCEYLHLERNQILQLNSMLANIRCKTENMPSQLNTLLFSLRSQRGLTIRQLSNLSGVPLTELNLLETDPFAVLSVESAEKLAPILESSSETLLRNYGADRFIDTAEENTRQKLPRLELFDLEQYDGQEPLIDFAWRHASEAVTLTHSLAIENPVVIQASGKELLLGFPGTVQLIVSETRPEGLKHELKLCRNEQRQFFIRRHNRTRIFRLAGMQKPALNTVWELYLAGLNIHFMK